METALKALFPLYEAVCYPENDIIETPYPQLYLYIYKITDKTNEKPQINNFTPIERLPEGKNIVRFVMRNGHAEVTAENARRARLLYNDRYVMEGTGREIYDNLTPCLLSHAINEQSPASVQIHIILPAVLFSAVLTHTADKRLRLPAESRQISSLHLFLRFCQSGSFRWRKLSCSC